MHRLGCLSLCQGPRPLPLQDLFDVAGDVEMVYLGVSKSSGTSLDRMCVPRRARPDAAICIGHHVHVYLPGNLLAEPLLGSTSGRPLLSMFDLGHLVFAWGWFDHDQAATSLYPRRGPTRVALRRLLAEGALFAPSLLD